ncbi:uncharacterized protein B0T15DRAFT_520711 [Chaetomium strumarium]|uniref:Uncharacterized protein n=1 Tax=Chaetomium strumarium TaxID=1170767 RepID=A0AAJ0M6S3_9PEZI|nr:hypothetical protein B0T15DRAFT_520711 [Chaetomium strumarium]
MASARNRKRAHADDLSQEHRSNKKIKSRGRLHGPSNFPPEFWDDLSKVPLTRRALRELDRRNSAWPAPRPVIPAVYTKNLARFARHGGPDFRHLRGVYICYSMIELIWCWNLTYAKRSSLANRRPPYIL